MSAPGLEIPADCSFHGCAPFTIGETLAGHVVVLVLFRPGCVHSAAALDEVAALHCRFAERPFWAVGVLAPSLAADRRDPVGAAERMAVQVPTVLDPDHCFRRVLELEAWPSVALVDARGAVRFRGPGVPDRERLAQAVDLLLLEAEAGGDLASQRAEEAPWEPPAPDGLRFPSRLCHDGERGWLWVVEGGRHRILAVDVARGALVKVLGSGQAGAGDGPAERASFCRPGGVAWSGGRLWIADTGNHLVRCWDPEDDRVATVLGTGRALHDTVGGQGGRSQGLDGPLDVVPWRDEGRGNGLVLVQGGAHQLWWFDLDTRVAMALAGGGVDGSADGRGDHAGLRGPWALAPGGSAVAFAEREGAAVRSLDVERGDVTTLVGKGLSGPSGLARWRQGYAIADTGGDALVLVDGAGREVGPRIGGLCRPEGVVVVGDRAYVADTGNHRLVTGDLPGGAPVPFPLQDYRPPAWGALRRSAPLSLQPETHLLVRIRLPLPLGEDVPPEVPVQVSAAGAVIDQPVRLFAEALAGVATVHGLVTAAGSATGDLVVDIDFLTGLDRTPHRHRVRYSIGITLAPDGADQFDLG